MGWREPLVGKPTQLSTSILRQERDAAPIPSWRITHYSALTREINQKGKEARFKKVDRGRFAANG